MQCNAIVPACLPASPPLQVQHTALPSLLHHLPRCSSPPCPYPPHCVCMQTFERQQQELNELARKLRLPAAGAGGGGGARPQQQPFSGEEWWWQLPDAELIAENVHQPPRQLPYEDQRPQLQQAAAAGGAAAAAADPRQQPEAAAELAAAAAWHAAQDMTLPVLPECNAGAAAVAPADSGLSWSQEPRAKEGQAEVSSSSAAAAAAAATADDQAPAEGGKHPPADAHAAAVAACCPALPVAALPVNANSTHSPGQCFFVPACCLLLLQMGCMPQRRRATTTLSTAPLAPRWRAAAAPPRRLSGRQKWRRATGRQ